MNMSRCRLTTGDVVPEGVNCGWISTGMMQMLWLLRRRPGAFDCEISEQTDWQSHASTNIIRLLFSTRVCSFYVCVFQHSVNATQRTYRKPQCRSHWLKVIAALIGQVRLRRCAKIEVVSICLRSAPQAPLRRRRLRKKVGYATLFCCVKTVAYTYKRCVAERL